MHLAMVAGENSKFALKYHVAPACKKLVLHQTLSTKKLIYAYAGLFQNGMHCSFRNITWMIGYCCISIGHWIMPDFMAPCRIAKKSEP